MGSSQYEKYCDWCGQSPLVDFNTKTGVLTKLTVCGCDYDARIPILMDGLKAIRDCTDENPVKIAEETLKAFKKKSQEM